MSSEETGPIKLDKFLKLVGAVGTGGEAKVLIQSDAVQINGQVEIRRGRKLKPNDVVEMEGESFTVESRGSRG